MKDKTIRKVPYRIAASVLRHPTEEAALAAITTQIERFWHRKDITLTPLEPGLSWTISLAEKPHDSARIIRQGHTYHFAFTA
jgi:hypothetical protein